MNTYVDLHVIQNVPPSCLNRDDSGSPKSAVYGGVRRLRVSSQSWKRATRLYFVDHLDESDLGQRTKRLVQVLSEEVAAQAPELAEVSSSLAEKVFRAAKIKLTEPRVKKNDDADRPLESGYLLFLSRRQIVGLAELAINAARAGEDLDKKAVKAIFKAKNSVDVALFGRMVADDVDLNVDAACQVAHAISTHAAETEYDFFTAVDDAKPDDEEDAGAGMMGTVEFSSGTLYRYATVNVDLLRENLGEREATLRALTTFIDGFVRSMPTGKQNTFANRTLPETVLVTLRDDQPVSLVGAFERPVKQDVVHGYVTRSVEALAERADKVGSAYGVVPLASFVVSLDDSEAVARLGERVSFADLSSRVREVISPRVADLEQV